MIMKYAFALSERPPQINWDSICAVERISLKNPHTPKSLDIFLFRLFLVIKPIRQGFFQTSSFSINV